MQWHVNNVAAAKLSGNALWMGLEASCMQALFEILVWLEGRLARAPPCRCTKPTQVDSGTKFQEYLIPRGQGVMAPLIVLALTIRFVALFINLIKFFSSWSSNNQAKSF